MYNKLFEWVLREADDLNEKSPLSEARRIARHALSQNIVENTVIEFTEENYRKELGGEIDTPLGKVKMSINNWGGGTKNSFQKMNDKAGRQDDIFKTKETLIGPSIIIKILDFENRYMYAKVFDDSALGGKERQIFYSIVDNNTVITNFNREHLRIRDFVKKFITSPKNLHWYKR